MVAAGVAATGQLVGPLAGARVAMVAADDVAASAAAALIDVRPLQAGIRTSPAPAAVTFDRGRRGSRAGDRSTAWSSWT